MNHLKHLITMQQSDDVVHIVDKDDAIKLITEGYVRKATIDPAPADDKLAINLTPLGWGYTETKGKSAPTPAPTPPAGS